MSSPPFFVDYAARAAMALARAENASDPEIADLHRRIAASYRELAKMAPPPDQPFGVANIPRPPGRGGNSDSAA